MSMSEKRLNLSNPLVIGVVLILLAVVLVVNIRTFGPKRPTRKNPIAKVQDYPSLPSDLDKVVRYSAMAGDGSVGLSAGSLPALGRDPFAAREAPVAQASARVNRETPVADKPDSLVCSAVMLGGHRPVALIGGESLVVGDRIREFRVMTIETNGVHLRAPDGSDLFLAIGNSGETARSFKIVTGVPANEDLGRTSLDDLDDKAEHKERQRP